MRSIHLALIALVLGLPLPCLAQSGAPQSATASSQDTAPAPKKKKGGLFGKMKGLAKNKTFQQVAKAAACNMVPGGQLVANAMDAKKNAKNAAKNAATGAALSAVGAKQQTCGAGGLMGGLTSKLAGGVPSGVPGAGVPGLPTTGLSGAAMSAKQLKLMEEQYRKLGMNPAQIQAMQQQAIQQQAMQQQMMATTGNGLSPEQMKQMQEQYRAMGIDPAQLQAMQQMAMAGATASPTPQVSAPQPSAAQPAIGPAFTREKSDLVLRQVPWTPGTEEIQSGAESALVLNLHNVAAEIIPTGKHYKVQVKVEEQGSKSRNQQLAQKRAAVVVAILVGEGVPQDRLTAAAGSADKDPRIVLSETKASK